MRRFFHFLQYNNAIPIGLFILFGMTGITFAASPEARKAVIDSTDTVQSVDNTYIVSADLANYDFKLQITDVKEDDEMYYVTYTYQTIEVVDYVWKEVQKVGTMKLSKKELTGRDLGTFVAKQLGEEMSAQLSYLVEVQEQERAKGASLKKVATEYTGLVGRMLNPKEKTFEGYKPVVEEKFGDENSAAAANALTPGESHIALPAIPTKREINALVSAAVSNALKQPTPTATSTASTATSTEAVATSTDQTADNSQGGGSTNNQNPDTGSGGGSGGSGGSTSTSTPSTGGGSTGGSTGGGSSNSTSTPSGSGGSSGGSSGGGSSASSTPSGSTTNSEPDPATSTPTTEPDPAPEPDPTPEPDPAPETPEQSTDTGTTTP